MPGTEDQGNTPERMRSYRARLRASGLRPVQIWVPDVRQPKLEAEAARQSRLAAGAAAEEEALAFIEATADMGSSV
ncbi:antitoxin MazE family protein [Tautonia rosea]|uniref:antitoxin MazE family protein n=1 Tax=Tautonia rosea TaxID=2728037 RepID=UPI0019D29904|nr:antitoxin MazE family protein [Tautonia rosea]